ncbi:hypothetical protein AMATHDRAFT_66198 [Amanita thiersii Skay4041]|uniref:precorrin-2 dehydrogenase n=1 Tax=Amanita thiersii Skay4041 TaxID=703135 RepID=A0A2A9NK64_9AGAR|nr:hypothetical protein AMATHDRAFT_66198 [Amanita thiersii Skay4041]
MVDTQYPTPKGGASLLLAFRLPGRTTLIIGSGRLAATRAFAALEADLAVVVLTSGGLASACDEIQWRAQQKQLTVLDWDSLPASSSAIHNDWEDREAEGLQFLLDDRPDIRLVCVTDTVLGMQRRSRASAALIARICKTHGIPINVTDIPDLCDFTFTSTHRFQDFTNSEPTCLQIGVTTNGKGCRLAGRVRREIVAMLPKEVGTAAKNVGRLRALTKAGKSLSGSGSNGIVGPSELDIDEDDVGEENGVATPNRPVPQRPQSETKVEIAKRRMQWVAQVSEYWPVSKLATLTEADIQNVLHDEPSRTVTETTINNMNGIVSPPSIHSLHMAPTPTKLGRIILVGSGPGHPSLLTVATHTVLTKMADLVLSDKLVPDAVLSLIPKSVEVKIAKKFPGNAEGAQNELMELAIDGARRGLTVVRLKQGDPSVFGRAGEEILYFRSHGFEPLVVPGVTSALAGPTFSGIPVTQRGVAESFAVCTGVGRKGREVQLPGYERGRTLVILMGVARLPQVVETLTSEDECANKGRDGPAYPPHTPIAIIERASMPDQRNVFSTLRDIVKALDSVGEQRPPGMIVVGWSVLALSGSGDLTVLDGEEGDVTRTTRDEERILRWLGEGKPTRRWRVQEGLADGWSEF